MARQAKPADPKVAGRGFRPCALRQWSVSHNPSIKEKGASGSQTEKILGMPENQDVAFKGCLLDNLRCDELGETHRHVLSANKSCKSTLQAREALKLVQKRCGGLPPLEMAMSQLMMFQPSHQWLFISLLFLTSKYL
jgi:hypothetical protein